MESPTRGAAMVRAAEAIVLVAGLSLLAACGDGGGPGERASSIETVSPARDTVEAGAALDPPLQVRVADAGGDPVAGARVRFQVTVGPGEVSESRVETGRDGLAATVYRDAERVGVARVEADLPDVPDVRSAAFSIRVVRPTSTSIRVAGGDGQEAETGSQLPRRLEVEVRSPSGASVGGVPVGWQVEETPGDAEVSLLVDTTYTDPDGRAWNLLTLGSSTGEYRVGARSEGSSEPAVFTATALESLPGEVTLDSVAPRPLAAGAEATLYGSGFASDASQVRVWVEGVEAELLAASADSLTARIPPFTDRCLPARRVGVRVESAGSQSNGRTVRLQPAGGFLSLSVGERKALSVPGDAACLQLDSAATNRAYRVVAQSASRVSGASTPMRLIIRSGADVGAAASLPRARSVEGPRMPSWVMGPEERGLELRRRLRERARAELLGRPGRGAEGPGWPSGRRTAVTGAAEAAPPETGDTLRLFLPVNQNLSVSCSDTSTVVTAVVREVGDHVALLEDTLSPAGGLSDSEMRTLAAEMDDAIFPADTSYFGSPADIDGNGRVLVLLTPEVNRLTPAGSEAFIGGFFLATDLVDSGDEAGGGIQGPGGETCPSSNEAEIVYLAAADPTGEFGISVSRERAMRNARSVSAHEIEHLLSAEQRIVHREGWVTDLEAAWLGEGLAHLAEEVAGMAVEGLSVRANLDYAAITGNRPAFEAFEAFFLNNFARGGLFMEAPGETLTIISRDPGGVESLKMRGFGWLLTRWLGDHFGPEGSGGPVAGSREERLFRRLSSGGPGAAQGIDNVLQAVESTHGSRPTWEELLADFAPMLAVEDDVPGLPDRLTLSTWDLRDVYRGIHEGSRGDTEPFTEAYPLRVIESGVATTAFDVDVNASGQVYFEVAGGPTAPAFSLSLRSQGGGALPAGARARVTVVRVQ